MDRAVTRFDWADFEDALVDGLVGAVRAVIAGDPGECFYAAALSHIYCETDGVISLPLLGIDSVSALREQGEADDGRPTGVPLMTSTWLPSPGRASAPGPSCAGSRTTSSSCSSSKAAPKN